MTKPVIVTRTGKGSSLSFTEVDANFTNLQNATLTVSDGTNSKALSLNDTLAFTAGSNVTLSVDSGTGAVTINASGGNIPIYDNNTITNSHIAWVDTTSSTLSTLYKTSGSLTFNPNAGTLSANNFVANGTGFQGAIGASVALAGSFTTLSASSTVSGTGFTNRFAAPGPIGSTTASTGAFTTLSASSTVSGTGFSNYLASPPAIGGTTASTGRFTTITSTAATGTAPFIVASTTNVANLNASSLNGATFASPGPIGSTTAGSGAFTTLSASSTVSGTGFSTYLASPPAIGSTTAGTGKFTSLEFKNPIETVFALTYAATLTPDAANGSVQKVTLTGAVTISALANPTAGETVTLILTQDATGGRTLTSTMKFAGGSKTLSTAANAIDIMTVFYDGTNYYASLSKGFA